MVAVLGHAEAEQLVGRQHHPATSEQHPGPCDEDLAVARCWRDGSPSLPAGAGQRPVAGAAAVQDVAVIGGEHDRPPGFSGRVQQPRQRSQGGQVPADPQLVAARQVVVHRVDHHADDPLLGIGDETVDLGRQCHPAGRDQIALVEEHRPAGRRRHRPERRMRGKAGAFLRLPSDGPPTAQQRRPADFGHGRQCRHTDRPAGLARRRGRRPALLAQVPEQDVGGRQAHPIADH